MYLLDQLRDYECLPGHQDVKLVLCIQPECKERKRIICQQLCVPYYHKHHKTIEISSIQTFFDELIKLEKPQLHVSVQESIDQIRILQREINHLIESIITKLVNHFGKFSLKAQKLAEEFQFKQTFDRLNSLYKDLPEVATFGDKIKIKLIKPLEPVSLDAALKDCIQKLAGFSIGKHDEYSQKPEDKVNFFSSHCRIIQGDHEIWCIAVGKNGTIASGGDDRRVTLWDIETQQMLWQTKKHKKAITTIRFSSDYQTLVSGSQDGKFKIWNMITQELIKKLQAHDCQISYIDYGRNNSLLMTASWDKSIKIWNLKEKYESTSLIGHDDIVYVALFNSECSFVVSCSLDTTIRFWDISQKPPQCEVMRGHSKRVDWITFSPNGKYLASCSSQEKLFIIWDPITRQQLWQNKTQHDPYRIAFSPDSKLLATSHKDIRIYDMQSRLQVGDPIQGHKFWIWSLKFSHDGRYILTGCQDKTIKIFGLPKQ